MESRFSCQAELKTWEGKEKLQFQKENPEFFRNMPNTATIFMIYRKCYWNYR